MHNLRLTLQPAGLHGALLCQMQQALPLPTAMLQPYTNNMLSCAEAQVQCSHPSEDPAQEDAAFACAAEARPCQVSMLNPSQDNTSISLTAGQASHTTIEQHTLWHESLFTQQAAASQHCVAIRRVYVAASACATHTMLSGLGKRSERVMAQLLDSIMGQAETSEDMPCAQL